MKWEKWRRKAQGGLTIPSEHSAWKVITLFTNVRNADCISVNKFTTKYTTYQKFDLVIFLPFSNVSTHGWKGAENFTPFSTLLVQEYHPPHQRQQIFCDPFNNNSLKCHTNPQASRWLSSPKICSLKYQLSLSLHKLIPLYQLYRSTPFHNKHYAFDISHK